MTGLGSLLFPWNISAASPVYIGDTITADAEVVSVHPTKPVCQLSIKVTRQTQEIVLEGEAWCYTFAPTPAPPQTIGRDH